MGHPLEANAGPAQARARNPAASGRTRGTGRRQALEPRPRAEHRPAGRSLGAGRRPERGGPGISLVARWAGLPAARTMPGMTAALGTRSAVHVTKATRGGGDRRQLNPWAASRCEDPLPTLLWPPWRAAQGREDAGSEKAFGEPQIRCLLWARRTQPPRARLGQRRTRGLGVVSPWRFLPPGAAPASGRATTLRSDAPGVC